MAYTNVNKPSGTSYSNIANTVGRESYDEAGTNYDTAIYYDGVDTRLYTSIPKTGYGGFLMKQDGFRLLLQTGANILLEGDYTTQYTNVAKPI